MTSNFIHGLKYSEIQSSLVDSLTPLQYELLKKIVPEKTSYQEFLSDDIIKLHSPFLFPDIVQSLNSIRNHIQNKSHILLFGDRDTDGVISTSLLAIYLREYVRIFGGKLSLRTSSEGDDYGLCESAVNFVQKVKPDLLITLDFGSSNYQEINQIANSGIEVIVIDHHEIPLQIPKCKLINPKRIDSKYPEPRICTSVIVMKLIFALYCVEIFEKSNSPVLSENLFDLKSYDYSQINILDYFQKHPELLHKYSELMDLASIGTITDMMPLLGENRIIVKNGLKTLSKLNPKNYKNRKGLYFLMQELKLNFLSITSKDLGWGVGPALNAAGRMGQTEIALKLLTTEDDPSARNAALELVKLNQNRKERTKKNSDIVIEHFQKYPEKLNSKVIFCFDETMQPGVSGIVATKLVQQYKKPAIFITFEHGNAKGSIRSYQNENVLDLLSQLEDLFIHYGGHPEAGGFSIEVENIPELERRVNQIAKQWLEEETDSDSNIASEVCLTPIELNASLYKELLLLEPFGQENQRPLLSVSSASIYNFKPMSENKHARFQIMNTNIKFLIWNECEALEKLISQKSKIDFWGHLEENYFNSTTTIQFVVSHFQ